MQYVCNMRAVSVPGHFEYYVIMHYVLPRYPVKRAYSVHPSIKDQSGSVQYHHGLPLDELM